MRVTVVGAGRSGVAAANLLARRGAEVTLTDAAPEEKLPLAAELERSVQRRFGSDPGEEILAADLIVLSPGVRSDRSILQKARAAGLEVISEVELAFRHLQGSVIAVTGSNGKSTTTSLIGEILRHGGYEPVVAGNIGEALSGVIDDRPRRYVLELSSFQLETIETFRADVAVLLNITPDHMDRYAALDDYIAAKWRIFRNQRPGDVAVVNADDPRASQPPTDATVWRFSSTRRIIPGAWLDGAELVVNIDGSESRISRAALMLEGMANVENALAAWLAARAAGASDDHVQAAFASFQGLPHRMVFVRELDGVRWINDSKGTNVDATLKSLEGAEDESVILILGGKDKKGEFERLGPLIERKVELALTIGEAAPRIESAIAGRCEIISCGDLSRAVHVARERAESGDSVLLSPACASFDQYENFEERGRHFESLVRSLNARDERPERREGAGGDR